MAEHLRIDKYLWAIRIFHTRSAAKAACDQGKVKAAGTAVKASRPVSAGELYEIRTPERRWVIQVTALLARRVGYAEAIKHYTDLTPAEDASRQKKQAAAFHGRRSGRPTKKERRDLDDFTRQE
jgi:ribosome-associated heat shock protein Hsp15